MALVCLKSHRIWLEPGAILNNLEVASVGHLGAVRKQLWSGPTSFAFKLPSVTPGHYNQLLNPDDFSDSSRTSELLMKKVLGTAQKDQRFVPVGSWAGLLPATEVGMEGRRCWSHQANRQYLPSATTLSLAQVLHIALILCFPCHTLWLGVWFMQGGIVSIFTYKLKMY